MCEGGSVAPTKLKPKSRKRKSNVDGMTEGRETLVDNPSIDDRKDKKVKKDKKDRKEKKDKKDKKHKSNTVQDDLV